MHKILIVDDESDVLDTLEVLIENKLTGCELVKANNGLDGFILCQKEKFDLIVTDHKMPFMTGAALVIGIRTRENQNKSNPVIMLSGFIDKDLRENLRIQHVEFVEKPFTPDHLIDIVRTYLV